MDALLTELQCELGRLGFESRHRIILEVAQVLIVLYQHPLSIRLVSKKATSFSYTQSFVLAYG